MLQPERLIILFQRKFRNKYKKYPYSLDTVRNTKWYPHFSNFSIVTRLEPGEEEVFLDRLFDTDEVVWPYVLSQKRAKQIERDITDKRVYFKLEKELTEKDYIKETLKNCKDWCKNNKIEKNQLGRFLTDPTNQFLAERGRYYLPLFLFSKTFLTKHELTDDDKLKKSSIRAFYVDVYEALKTSLKDDFID